MSKKITHKSPVIDLDGVKYSYSDSTLRLLSFYEEDDVNKPIVLVKKSSNIAAMTVGSVKDPFLMVQFKKGEKLSEETYFYQRVDVEIIELLRGGDYDSIGKVYAGLIKNKFESRKQPVKIIKNHEL